MQDRRLERKPPDERAQCSQVRVWAAKLWLGDEHAHLVHLARRWLILPCTRRRDRPARPSARARCSTSALMELLVLAALG
jgi:hypothetical protein